MKFEEGFKMIERIQKCIANLEMALAAGIVTQTRKESFNGFLESIGDQTKRGRALSPGQSKFLRDIESICDEEALKEADEWIKQYSDDLREVSILSAEYYENQTDDNRYFKSIRRKVLDNPRGHVLSKREFTKMCMNKYADKVIQESQTDPKFEEGQIVSVRASNRLDLSPYSSMEERKRNYKLYREAARGNKVLALILKSNARPMYRSTQGGKVYSILPIGESMPLFACEIDLKKMRK